MLLEIAVFGGVSYAIRRYQVHREQRSMQYIPSFAGKSFDDLPDVRLLRQEEKLDQELGISLISLITAITASMNRSIPQVLGLPGTIYVMMPVYEETFHALRQKQLNSASLLGIITGLCLATGLYVTANLSAVLYTFSRKSLVTLQRQSRRSVLESFDYYPEAVWLDANGVEVRTEFKNLKIGDVVIVSAGEAVPADGYIVKGNAEIDQHMLTGEFHAVSKQSGDYAFAASKLLNGRITLQVERLRQQTAAAEIEKAVKNMLS